MKMIDSLLFGVGDRGEHQPDQEHRNGNGPQQAHEPLAAAAKALIDKGNGDDSAPPRWPARLTPGKKLMIANGIAAKAQQREGPSTGLAYIIGSDDPP
jgi:hypothetical protein